MTNETHLEFSKRLQRSDGQEDLSFCTWSPSTGNRRTTTIIRSLIPPLEEERNIHGNASFESAYAMRAVNEAASLGRGLGLVHTHPFGTGWQSLSHLDSKAEAGLANLAREVTGLPLLGLTLSGDDSWSGRCWHGVGREVAPNHLESVRIIGNVLTVGFNDLLVPRPKVTASQIRTVSVWGDETQENIARLRVAVVGVGSVGMFIAEVLSRTGIQRIGVFDFDGVEMVNLDRLHGATTLDVAFKRGKARVAHKIVHESSTANQTQHSFSELSVCEPEGMSHLLDYDVVFSCVDRPWPRHVLNRVAYTDLIPVIDGGLRAFQNSDGSFRNAYWRTSLVRPGRPCLACLGQYERADVQLERDGSLDDPSYIESLQDDDARRRNENVAALSASVSAAMLLQFVSYVAAPSGIGDPGPLSFDARLHTGQQVDVVSCRPSCYESGAVGVGDGRHDPTGVHRTAERSRRSRREVSLVIRIVRRVDDLLWEARNMAARVFLSR